MSEYFTFKEESGLSTYIIQKRVTGASHLRTGKECQDYLDSRVLQDGAILMSVADGHGSSSCPFSADGSRLATIAFLDLMQEFCEGYREDMAQLKSYLNREGDNCVAREIWTRWEEAVLLLHEAEQREPVRTDGIHEKDYRNTVCRMYGTTLLGLMLTADFLFGFQLGDGDMMYINPEGASPVVEGDKLLGVETHSMGSRDGWKKSVSLVRTRPEHGPHMFMMTTDGFANSYASDEDYVSTCCDYFRAVEQYGPENIAQELENWLTETSAGGCGDDISMLLCYCTGNKENPGTPEKPEGVEEDRPEEEGQETAPTTGEAEESAGSEPVLLEGEREDELSISPEDESLPVMTKLAEEQGSVSDDTKEKPAKGLFSFVKKMKKRTE